MRTDETSTEPWVDITCISPDRWATQPHGSLLLDDVFRRAQAVIDARYGDFHLSPMVVARYVGCSRATLYRAFQPHGLTVSGYIQQVRFEQVRRGLELLAPRIPISSIAMDCGFECLRHFHRRFKQVFGDTPGAYRHRLHRHLEVKRRHVPDWDGTSSLAPESRATVAHRDTPWPYRPTHRGIAVTTAAAARAERGIPELVDREGT